MALKFELGNGGFSLFDAWSQLSHRYKAADTKSVWRSFKKGSIRIASLFYMAKEQGWRRDADFVEPPAPLKSTPPKAAPDTLHYALKLFSKSSTDDSAVAAHLYCKTKGISHAGGAGVVTGSGRIIGTNASCICLPIRGTRVGELQGVQLINEGGAKQSFGRVSGGCLLLGNTLDKSLVWSVTEGWASAYSILFHHLNGHGVVAVAFGKSNLTPCAETLAEVHQPGNIQIIAEQD